MVIYKANTDKEYRSNLVNGTVTDQMFKIQVYRDHEKKIQTPLPIPKFYLTVWEP